MKICVITYAFSPHNIGGADLRMEERVQELKKRGNEVIVITISPERRYKIEERQGIKIYWVSPLNISTFHNIGKSNLFGKCIWSFLDFYSPPLYYKIKDILKYEKPDVIHLTTPLDFTLSVFNVIKDLNIPLVFTVADYLTLCRRLTLLHGSGQECNELNLNPLCALYRNFSKSIINHCPMVVTFPSSFVLKIYNKNGFFGKSKKFILPNAIKTNLHPNLKFFKDTHRKIYFLYVGGLTKHKGVDILIRAFKEIKNPRINLEIVGKGICQRELECLASSDKRIKFAGKLSYKHTQKKYQNSKVLVVPSICNETFGTVILEAFNNGAVVIASKMGAFPEIIRDKYNGFLFKSQNVRELKSIMEAAIKNPRHVEKIRRNALNSLKKYKFEDHINKLIKIYQTAISMRYDNK
jgi:glycosyltransferase involved in cell wall biosynthesis